MSNKNKEIEVLLNRSVVDCIERKDLERKLSSGKKLRVKLGIDPTGANIHVGRAVPLRKLAAFQKLGHQVILIIGDFTGTIGDTSDKESERPMLSQKEVDKNAENYLEQVGKIIDIKKCEIHRNSEWLDKLTLREFLSIANNFTLAETNQRDNFAKRLKNNKRVSLREVLYPLLQAYDSVMIKSDVELGGKDQLFNILAGRTLQKVYEQSPQNILTFPILIGTDGRKMSTSWGNCIYINDIPSEIFGKAMSIPDEYIIEWAEIATDLDFEKFDQRLKDGENPRNLKAELASELVRMYHGEDEAKKASEEFTNIFKKQGKPSDIKSISGIKSTKILDLLVETKLSSSKSEAKRLIEQGGVKVNDKKVTDLAQEIPTGDWVTIQVGKRKWIKVRTDIVDNIGKESVTKVMKIIKPIM